VISGPFALALSSGMLATVNPCGFAMLPAYLSYFLGLSGEGTEHRSTSKALARALVVSAALLAGFFVVFVSFGIVVRGLGVSQGDVLRYAKWPATIIGVTLIVVGIAMLAGWHLPIATPRMSAGGKDTTLTSMSLFGVSYAVTSLSCGSGPFIGTVMNSFSLQGYVSGVAVFASYALGMGMVVTALTVSMSLAQQGFLRVLRASMRYVDRIAGVLLVGAGAYLIYYWAFNGGERDNPVATLQGRVEAWFLNRSLWTLTFVFGGIVVAAAATVAASAGYGAKRSKVQDRSA
jgi:cytochrome c-type biogenesis protein